MRYSATAKDILSSLKALMDEVNDLSPREECRVASALEDVYTHTMDSDPESPPLGLDWTLRDGGVAKAIFEEMTGKTCGVKESA